ncbi:VOC family protein [Actinopolymorpha sp. NPDC004070]|uniref:VOC family protein n=1 Tax=Actinopolymorpha sp. NPDC004070 TaxID=3154548 RepID=UPI0033BB6C13
METVAESAVGTPHLSLTPYVERYSGYRYLGFAPGIHRGLPSGSLTFIVSVGPAIDVAVHTDPTRAPRSYRAVLSGLQATSALISHSGDQEGVAIHLTADGCRALFGLPAGGLWDTSLELNEVVGRTGDELWERMQYAATWDERFAACDAVLRRLVIDNPLSAELRRAWRLIVASGGTWPWPTWRARSAGAGSTWPGGSPSSSGPGTDLVYVVCEDPDALFARATAAGAEVVAGLKDEGYGNRGVSVRDLEGNLWSFGTYAGE